MKHDHFGHLFFHAHCKWKCQSFCQLFEQAFMNVGLLSNHSLSLPNGKVFKDWLFLQQPGNPILMGYFQPINQSLMGYLINHFWATSGYGDPLSRAAWLSATCLSVLLGFISLLPVTGTLWVPDISAHFSCCWKPWAILASTQTPSEGCTK